MTVRRCQKIQLRAKSTICTNRTTSHAHHATPADDARRTYHSKTHVCCTAVLPPLERPGISQPQAGRKAGNAAGKKSTVIPSIRRAPSECVDLGLRSWEDLLVELHLPRFSIFCSVVYNGLSGPRSVRGNHPAGVDDI
uniref:(northern house mosquito) hypothetical protein n=1 Tax=Culex pipiens TaxID=7175 RepID=A0A8D8F6W4_CULPI